MKRFFSFPLFVIDALCEFLYFGQPWRRTVRRIEIATIRVFRPLLWMLQAALVMFSPDRTWRVSTGTGWIFWFTTRDKAMRFAREKATRKTVPVHIVEDEVTRMLSILPVDQSTALVRM